MNHVFIITRNLDVIDNGFSRHTVTKKYFSCNKGLTVTIISLLDSAAGNDSRYLSTSYLLLL